MAICKKEPELYTADSELTLTDAVAIKEPH